MDSKVEQEIKGLIEYYKLKCSVEEFTENAKWKKISRHPNLSEDFIREFQDKVDWILISRYQNLSESFIREFRDKVNLTYIHLYQNVTKDFITEMLEGHCHKNSDGSSEKMEEFVGKINDKGAKDEMEGVKPSMSDGNRQQPRVCCKCKNNDTSKLKIGKIFICYPKKNNRTHINDEVKKPVDDFKENYDAIKSIADFVCDVCSKRTLEEERSKSVKSGLISLPFVLPIVIIPIVLILNYAWSLDGRIAGKLAPLAGIIIIPLLGILWGRIKKIFCWGITLRWVRDKIVLDNYIEKENPSLSNMEIFTWYDIDKERQNDNIQQENEALFDRTELDQFITKAEEKIPVDKFSNRAQMAPEKVIQEIKAGRLKGFIKDGQWFVES